MMDYTIWPALIEWFSTNALQKVAQTFSISEYNYFDVTCQVRSKVGNVSNFKSVGLGLNNIKEIWRNDKAFRK